MTKPEYTKRELQEMYLEACASRDEWYGKYKSAGLFSLHTVSETYPLYLKYKAQAEAIKELLSI